MASYKRVDGSLARKLIALLAFAALVKRALQFGLFADFISLEPGELEPGTPQERIEVGDWLPFVLGHDATPFSPILPRRW
jgi:hypothetical protein